MCIRDRHNAGAHGGHLRAEARADDGGHQVAAESGTGHLQVAGDVVLLAQHHGAVQAIDLLLGQSGALLQEVLVDAHVHVQVGAVSAQARVQTCRAAGAQVTADVGGADQEGLGLHLLDDIADDLGIGVGVKGSILIISPGSIQI